MHTAFGDEDDCGTRRTSAGTAAAVVRVRRNTSGAPKALEARMVIIATSLVAVSAFIPSPLDEPVAVIFVPGRSGANVLRIVSGMPRCIKARKVFGCRTSRPSPRDQTPRDKTSRESSTRQVPAGDQR